MFAMDDYDANDNIFWFILGYMAGGGESSIRPRDKWDVVVYVVVAVFVVAALVYANW